jgi:hypothetical protein
MHALAAGGIAMRTWVSFGVVLSSVLVLAPGCRSTRRAPAPATARAERQVFLDMTTARIPAGGLARVPELRRGPGEPSHVVVSAERAKEILGAWSSDGNVSTIIAPKILALSGQEASMFVAESPKAGSVPPADADAWVGEKVVVVPTATGPDALNVDFRQTWRARKAGAPEGSWPTAADEGRLTGRFDLPDGGYALLRPEEAGAGGAYRVTLLHATLLRGTD